MLIPIQLQKTLQGMVHDSHFLVKLAANTTMVLCKEAVPLPRIEHYES